MEDLIVVTYENEYGALENMRVLRTLDYEWLVDIRDAVAVARDADGKLHVQDSYKATAESAAGWGVLVGTILGGLALAPLTGGLSATAAAGMVAVGAVGGAGLGGIGSALAASDEKANHGISEAFVSAVADSLKRGQSALFAMVDSNDPDRAVSYFRGTGGKIIETRLSWLERQRMQQILDGKY